MLPTGLGKMAFQLPGTCSTHNDQAANRRLITTPDCCNGDSQKSQWIFICITATGLHTIYTHEFTRRCKFAN